VEGRARGAHRRPTAAEAVARFDGFIEAFRQCFADMHV
jgi:hypothetical protein